MISGDRMSKTDDLTIGALASAAEVGIETIRFYERKGLLPEPPRTQAGYRQYTPDTVHRLRFIRRAQGLGFSLAEISELLDLRIAELSACGTVEPGRGRRGALVLGRPDGDLRRGRAPCLGLWIEPLPIFSKRNDARELLKLTPAQRPRHGAPRYAVPCRLGFLVEQIRVSQHER